MNKLLVSQEEAAQILSISKRSVEYLGRVNTIHDIIAINGDHSGAVRED